MNPFIGQVVMFGGNFAPRGWAFCDGQLLSISANTALFSILGTTYGGDGRSTFGLPDLRGRVAIHFGRGPGLSYHALGQRGGSQTNTLNQLHLPSHTHTGTAALPVSSGPGDSTNPVGNAPAETDSDNYSLGDETNTATVSLNPTGGGEPVNNIQPYQTVSYIIALVGTFPSRN